MLIWLAAVTNVFFGFRSKIEMKRIPNESQVYQVLKKNIVEPGGYVCNPPLTPVGVFPLDEPVFNIRYSGMGHEATAQELVVQLTAAVITMTIAAWMPSVTAIRILASHARRVFFFTVIGLLLAVFSDPAKFGIGGLPWRSALLLAANDFISWTLAGLVVAQWIATPRHAAPVS